MDATTTTISENEVPAASAPTVPIQMSFPAALRNPGLSRYLQQASDGPKPASVAPVVRKNRRVDKDGKRWIRRAENSRFVGNPHIVPATRKDYTISAPTTRTTFPEPLPAYLPRNTPIPPTTPPVRQPISANAGRFSLSLKGMRRELRGSGPRTEQLVREVETEVINWLHDGGVMLAPDTSNTLNFPGITIGETESIKEVSRTPLQLVWLIENDAHARYVVHCTARFYEIVSFSKETSGQRLTYLLRPNVMRPDHNAKSLLETPPVTDLSAHEFDTESDFVSERSDAMSELGDLHADHLSIISERSRASSPARSLSAVPRGQLTEDEWSVIGETDGEADGSEHGDAGLADSVQSLSLRDDMDSAQRPALALRQRATFRTGWDNRQGRSGSSPSRSPARRGAKRMHRRIEDPKGRGSRSFYDYLFA